MCQSTRTCASQESTGRLRQGIHRQTVVAAVLVLEMVGDQSGGGGVTVAYPLRFPCSPETRLRLLAGAVGEGAVEPRGAFDTLA